jgi:uncharacterized protein (DUF433 family)
MLRNSPVTCRLCTYANTENQDERRGDSIEAKGLVLEADGMIKHLSRITTDPAVMGGKACIRGLRVTVGMIVGLLACRRSRDEILRAYPYLEPVDIDKALAYAAWRVEEREVDLTLA